MAVSNDFVVSEISFCEYTDQNIREVAAHLDTTEAWIRAYLTGDDRSSEIDGAIYYITGMYPIHWVARSSAL